MSSNSRIHLTRWAVTALAEKHRRQDHRPGLPGPRRTSPAGDANVRPTWNGALAIKATIVALLLMVASGYVPALSGECTSGEKWLLARLEYWSGRPYGDDPRACGEIQEALQCLVYNRIDQRRWAGPNAAGYLKSLRESPLRPQVISACAPYLTAPPCALYGELALPAASDLAMYGVQSVSGQDVLGILLARCHASRSQLPYLALAGIGDSRVPGLLRTTYDSLSVVSRAKATRYERLQLVNCLYHVPGDSSLALASAIAATDPDTEVVARARHVVASRGQR
jgi:hypothetical protein